MNNNNNFEQKIWESTLRSAVALRRLMDYLLSKYPEGSTARKEIEAILKEKRND